jgi:hypothetical protein
VPAGSGDGQRTGGNDRQRHGGGQPKEWQPQASCAFRLTERARGGDRDDRGSQGLENQRQLQRAIGVPVPGQRDPQPDRAGSERCQRRRNPTADQMEPR